MTIPASPRSAWLALAVGLGSALVSAYWGSGGTGLLDTLGGTLEAAARRGGSGVAVALWGVAVVKVIGSMLPVLATDAGAGSRRSVLRLLAWTEAFVLTGYGLVLTGVGLLVQAGIAASVHADHRALAWHAYLWDPWFLVWGLLCVAALRVSRRAASAPASQDPDTTVTDR